MAITALLIIFAFMLGSIPFGDIIARVRGIDIRKVGSGNIGATNVLRAAGWAPAILTLAGDIMKGIVAVSAAGYVVNDPLAEGAVGISAIAGHIFSVFLRLKGGKGVATAIGVLLVYAPKVAAFTVALWLVVALITRYSSLGALVSFAALPLAMYLLEGTKEKVFVSLVISGLLIFRHRENIGRLLRGAESRIGEKT